MFISPNSIHLFVPTNHAGLLVLQLKVPQNGTSQVTISSETELENLRKEINKAKENGKSIIEYKNAQIDMEDALFLADCAAQQLKAPSKPFNAESVDNKKCLL